VVAIRRQPLGADTTRDGVGGPVSRPPHLQRIVRAVPRHSVVRRTLLDSTFTRTLSNLSVCGARSTELPDSTDSALTEGSPPGR
jgi:hypothetical protein